MGKGGVFRKKAVLGEVSKFKMGGVLVQATLCKVYEAPGIVSLLDLVPRFQPFHSRVFTWTPCGTLHIAAG